MTAGIDVYLETAPRRVFACAVDWPPWCRAGRTVELALEALAVSAPRFAIVAREAGHPLPSVAEGFRVAEEVVGSATTEFGVPAELSQGDARGLTTADAERLIALVAASWRVFDDVAGRSPATLRKGPRGGGRDRDRMIAHVVESEARYYTRKLGLPASSPDPGDGQAVARIREGILNVLRAARSGSQLTERGWTPRYAARRISWHVVDHAWEMEDRSRRTDTPK